MIKDISTQIIKIDITGSLRSDDTDLGEMPTQAVEDLGALADQHLTNLVLHQAAIYAAELTRFIRDYVGNGELHIYDADSRNLLSRVDSFIPTNYWANHEALNEQIARWTEEAERRVSAVSDRGTPAL